MGLTLVFEKGNRLKTPPSSILFNYSTINNIKIDTLKFGSALLFSHIVAGKNLIEKNYTNSKSILLSLIGLIVYQSIISKIFIIESLDPELKILFDDMFKFSTMIFVFKYFRDYNNLYTRDFGLTIFNLFLYYKFK